MADSVNAKAQISKIFKNLDSETLSKIGEHFNVDYRVRALTGEVTLKLLISGNLLTTENSQYKLADIFSSEIFKKLVTDCMPDTVSRQSVGNRIKTIPSDYFKEIYQQQHELYKKLLDPLVFNGFEIEVADSTMVAETANKLIDGMSSGRRPGPDNGSRKKQVKYTVLFDGISALHAKLYTAPTYLNEDVPLRDAILAGVKTNGKEKVIYSFDRGIKSNIILDDFSGEDIRFVGRFNNKRRMHVVAGSPAGQGALLEGCKLVSDKIVQLYEAKTKRLLPNMLRIVEVEMPQPIGVRHGLKKGERTLKLVTDDFSLSVADIMEIYRERWTIEVFFKFLKSNLNFGHFLSIDKNGMESVLWVTLLTALLVKVFTKECNLKKNNAVFLMRLRLTDMIIEDAEKIKAITRCSKQPPKTLTKAKKRSTCH